MHDLQKSAGTSSAQWEYGHEAMRARQGAFNALKYTPIVSSNRLYSYVQSLYIIQHEGIPEPQIIQLRDRLFDVLWTFHIGGFENYMRLRKPEGIEYQFDSKYRRTERQY